MAKRRREIEDYRAKGATPERWDFTLEAEELLLTTMIEESGFHGAALDALIERIKAYGDLGKEARDLYTQSEVGKHVKLVKHRYAIERLEQELQETKASQGSE